MTDCTTTERRLVDFLEDLLPEVQRSEVSSHLETCPACRDAVRSARLVRAAYAETALEDVGPELAGPLLDQARDAVGTTSGPRRSRWPLALAAAAAALVVLALWQRPRPPEGPTPAPSPGQRVAELLEQGDALRDAGEPERAVTPYARALRLASAPADRAAIHHRLADVHLRLDRPEAARDELEAVLAAGPGYERRGDALMLHGEVLEALGRPREAALAYRRFADENPDRRAAVERRLEDLQPALDAQRLGQLRELGYIGDG